MEIARSCHVAVQPLRITIQNRNNYHPPASTSLQPTRRLFEGSAPTEGARIMWTPSRESKAQAFGVDCGRILRRRLAISGYVVSTSQIDS